MKTVAHIWSTIHRVCDDIGDYGDRGYKINFSKSTAERDDELIYFMDRTNMDKGMRGRIFHMIRFMNFEPTDEEIKFAKSRISRKWESA